jgi:exocyst complex component 8
MCISSYAEFVHISEEISAFENELLELKEALFEWKSMPSFLQVENDASAVERRRNVRSFVTDLKVLYASQMQALHLQVEGSGEFVPTMLGYHVVAEIDNGVVALHPATYRPSHSVRFVVLNDSALVARRRKRRAEGGKGAGWVAERCWPLAQMVVLDTKDQPSTSPPY